MFEAPSYMPSAVARPSDVAPPFAPLAAIDFHRICTILWRGKFTILLTTAAALIAAALYVLLVPYKYTATTQILVDPMELHAVANELTSANQQSDAAVLTVESQVSVIMSDNVLSRVVASEGLDHDPEFARGAQSLEHGPLAALNELKRHVKVTRAERTYVLDVSVTSEDPAKAARIANAIAQTYLTEQTEVRADSARQVSQSLTARLKELQGRVRDAEDKVEAYKAKNNIVGANGELVNEQQLANLNGQLVAARGRTAEAKARLDQVESVQQSKAPIGAFPEALQSQTITALRTQYAEIMRREAEQKSSLGERHPAVIEIEAQAERLQKMIDDEVNRIALSARAEYQRAKSDEDTLSRNLDTLKNTAIDTNQSLVGLRELEREVAASRAVYEAFLVRARETGEQEQVDTKNMRVITRADLPLQRSSPPSSLLLGLAAMMLGAASGTGIVFMQAAYAETGPRSRDRSGLPHRLSAAAKRFIPAPSAAPSIPVIATLPQVDISYGLDAVDNPHSRFATEINKVYEAVRASHNRRGNPSVLVVASHDEDDTASVALTLAAAVAATQRVLLIDADLQRRTLSAIDADHGDAGLVDVAVGRLELSDVIVRDRDTNINVVSLVSPNSRRDRPISDTDVRHAFNKTRRFDMVIVAAVNLSRDPSTRFFAGLVDHIVLVARADARDERAVEQFVSRLGPDARKVRGAVLTGVGRA
jgi:succinoglycan biosynthesis transport protein ExoP